MLYVSRTEQTEWTGDTECCKTFRALITCVPSRNATANVRKWQKTSFFALFCTIYAHYVYLIDCAWPLTTTICWETIRTTIICNIESLGATKLDQSAENLFFALFCTIYALYAYLINYAWPKTTATCWETFRTTTICNIVLNRATKAEKKANVHMCTFMHIVQEPDFSRKIGLC